MEKYYKDIINILKDYGYAIKYIENPSEEVQILAVMEEESVIRYIKNPTDKVKELVRKIEEQNDYRKKYEELLEAYKTMYEELVKKLKEQNDYKTKYEELLEELEELKELIENKEQK